MRNEKNDEDNGPPYPPNLLVRLNPYDVLAKVKTPGLPVGWRDKLLAEWNGNDVVAVWVYAKWGIANLSVYEIANDKLKADPSGLSRSAGSISIAISTNGF